MVLSVNGMPAACAARQARISPSPCCMPAEADRRERERQRHRLADDGGGEIAARHVDQHALAQLDPLEIGAVGAQRLLRIGAGLGIVEEHPRDLAAGELPQVLDAGDGVMHGHALAVGRCSIPRAIRGLPRPGTLKVARRVNCETRSAGRSSPGDVSMGIRTKPRRRMRFWKRKASARQTRGREEAAQATAREVAGRRPGGQLSGVRSDQRDAAAAQRCRTSAKARGQRNSKALC